MAICKVPRLNLDQRRDEGRPEKKGSDELLAHMRSMMDDPDSSDVAFRCSDGVSVHACRWMLASRCTVLKSMLSNGMLESTMPEISLPNLPSRVMQSVLEYLYTGSIESYPLHDWKMGLEMMQGAQYFMIPALEIIARDYLQRKMEDVCNSGFDYDCIPMLNAAAEFQETWNGKQEMLWKLIRHMGDDWYADHFPGSDNFMLSKDAADYILCNFKRDRDDKAKQPAMQEYCMLRNIVLWHAHACGAQVKGILPQSNQLWPRMVKIPDLDQFLVDVSVSMDSSGSTDVLNSMVQENIDKNSLKHMLRHVDLSFMPASLLVTIVYPLKIFPSQQLLKAVISSAFDRGVQRSLRRSDWFSRCPPWIRIGDENEDGCVWCRNRVGTFSGTAIAKIVNPSSIGSYEWSFEVVEDEADTLDVGFVCTSPSNAKLLHEITAKSPWDFSEAKMVCIDRKKSRTTICNAKVSDSSCYDWKNFDTELEKRSSVNFRFDALRRTCEVQFGGRVQWTWKELPVGEYLPAVSFFSCVYGKVRLRLGPGFHYF